MYSMKITPKYVWDSCVLAYICYEMDQWIHDV